MLTSTNALVALSTTPPSIPPQVIPPPPELAALTASVAPTSTAAPQLVDNWGPSVGTLLGLGPNDGINVACYSRGNVSIQELEVIVLPCDQ